MRQVPVIGQITTQVAREVLERAGYQVTPPDEERLGIPIIESQDVEPGTVILFHDGQVVGQIRNLAAESAEASGEESPG